MNSKVFETQARLSGALSDTGEERMLHILDNAPDMIFMFAHSTLSFEFTNKSVTGSTGYTQDELCDMTLLDILSLSSEAEFRAFAAPLVGGTQETLRFETTLLCKGGRELPVEVQLQLVKQAVHDGLFVAIVRDIQQRKEAERELRDQKNLMRQVIDTDPNEIFVKDEQGRFVLANQAVADYYGMAIPQLIGRTDSEVNPDRLEAEGFMAADREVINSRREVVMTEMLTRDGKQRWVHTVKRPLYHEDGSVHVLGIAVDITGLKQSETRLAESYRELQRLSLHLENVRTEERTRIARNLHDEMGATLAALKMRIGWLASKLPGALPELTGEVKHLSELVSDGIRTMRKVVSELRPNLLDDVGLAEAVHDYAKKFQRDTEIECTVELPKQGFRLDGEQSATVFRIIQESLSNVAKHARASKVGVIIGIEGKSLLLQITDNGIGFDTGRKSQSFGLLGIKERALMIGGKATITSEPGKGTEVKLCIPLPRDEKIGLKC